MRPDPSHQRERLYLGRKIEKRLAPKSIRAVHNTLRQTFDYARRARYVTSNPALDVRGLPEINAWRIDAPTVEEVNEFLGAVRETKGPTWFAYVVLVASTGMRRGEACALQWRKRRPRRARGPDRARRDHGERQRQAHQGVSEDAAVHPDDQDRPDGRGGLRRAARSTRSRTKRRRDGFAARGLLRLLAGPVREDFFSPYSVSQMFRRVQEHLEENGVHCHRLRHFSATQAVLQGVPITEVMGRHGWTSYQTAMKYQHYTGARDGEAARAVESVLDINRPSNAEEPR